MTVHLAIRGYAGNRKIFEDRLDLGDSELSGVLAVLANQHAAALMAHELHMIEIEFLDEPDPEQRFFRFGTDPAGMVAPVHIKLGDAS